MGAECEWHASRAADPLATQAANARALKQTYHFANYQTLLIAKYKADVTSAAAEATARSIKAAQVVAEKLKLTQAPLGTWCKKFMPQGGENPTLGKACKSNCRMLPCVFWNRRAEEVNAPTYDAELL